jgi:hypothetical protein
MSDAQVDARVGDYDGAGRLVGTQDWQVQSASTWDALASWLDGRRSPSARVLNRSRTRRSLLSGRGHLKRWDERTWQLDPE